MHNESRKTYATQYHRGQVRGMQRRVNDPTTLTVEVVLLVDFDRVRGIRGRTVSVAHRERIAENYHFDALVERRDVSHSLVSAASGAAYEAALSGRRLVNGSRNTRNRCNTVPAEEHQRGGRTVCEDPMTNWKDPEGVLVRRYLHDDIDDTQ